MLNRTFGRRLLAAAAAGLIAGACGATPAAAADWQTWYWLTTRDANPLPYSECMRRAPIALSGQGLNVRQNYNGWFGYSASPNVGASIYCINPADGLGVQGARGFYMVLSAFSDDPSIRATELGNRINASFWGTAVQTPTQPSAGVAWQLASTCTYYGDGAGHGGTVTLFQAADGTLSGTVQNDGGFGTTILADGTGYGNWVPGMRSQQRGYTITLVMHPASWISVLQLTGTVNQAGTRIDGAVHHYGNDDCSFSMTR